MLTATGSQLILDVLAMFQAQDKVFTAYDVTVMVRTKTHENIHHTDVQSLVHDQWLTGEFEDNYIRDDMVQLNTSGNPYAMVYYPDIKGSSDHPLALDQDASSAPAIQPQPAPYQHPLSTGSMPTTTTPAKKLGGSTKQADGSYVCELTSEGRINIPKEMVDKVNKDGNTVDITINGTLIIATPNKDGRIRLNLLHRGFTIGDGAYVELTPGNASITVGGMS